MEDNIYELSKAWKQLDESFTRIDEKKSKKGLSKNDHQSATKGRATQIHGPTKYKPAPRNKKVEIDETTGAAAAIPGGSTSAGPIDATVAGGGNVAQYKKKLGEKKVCKEGFDIASLSGPAPEVPEMEMGAKVESPAVSDIIAGLQARYPGAIIEISVTAPDGHRFSDTDIACATEVANASEAPEELGGAWAKVDGEEEEEEEEEGEEDSDEGTKPLKEAYPPSFGKKDDAGEEDSGNEEETEEDDEEETEDKPAFGGEKEEGEEIESCAGISQDCITLSPEGWSAFLVQVDSQGCGEEGSEEEIDESGITEPDPDRDPAVQDQVAKDQKKLSRKPIPQDPTETEEPSEDDRMFEARKTQKRR
jgi:hypothetical protein